MAGESARPPPLEHTVARPRFRPLLDSILEKPDANLDADTMISILWSGGAGGKLETRRMENFKFHVTRFRLKSNMTH